jgi:uncharacterized protein YebE (UPF0316 family)
MTPLAAGLFVFFMRVIDMSLDTLRMLFVMRGWKFQAGALGAVQATVFILAVSAVLQGPLNVYTVVGYAAGFGTGVILGMVAEERLALGYLMFRIYSSTHGPEITQQLRAAGFAVTEFVGQGRDGTLTVINSAIARRHRQMVRALVEHIDPVAFITVDDVHPLQRGYFRH